MTEPYKRKNPVFSLKYTTLMVTAALFLASCDNGPDHTAVKYSEIAAEAHATGDSRTAIFELAEAIRHYPDNADLQLLRGKIFLDLEDGTAAEIAFNKAIALGYDANLITYEMAQAWLYQRNPGQVIDTLEPRIIKGLRDPLLYEITGRAYIATRDEANPTLFIQNMEKAEKYIDEAFRLNPKNTRVLIAKAWVSATMGKLDDAIMWLDKADDLVTDQRENLSIRGELLIRQDKVDQAQVVYKKLVRKFPQYPQYKLELGYSYLLNNSYDTAREWIAPVAKQYPTQLRPKYLMASIALMKKDYETAKNLTDAVLAKNPESLKTVLVNGASAYFLGDYEKAHQKLSHFYNRTNSIPALKLLAATKLKLNESESAAALLRESGLDTTVQTDGELLNLVAIASAKIGRTDVALEAYKKLSTLEPDSPAIQNNIGLIQIAQGQYEEGFKNLEKALDDIADKLAPGQRYYILATKSLNVRQYERAGAYIEQYKEVASDQAEPWMISAVLQTTLKNWDAARADFDKALALEPEQASVKARYAIFEKMQGRDDRALELAEQALALNPSDVGSAKIVFDRMMLDKKFDDLRARVDKAIANKTILQGNKLFFADYYTQLGRPQETLAVLDPMPDDIKQSAAYKVIAGKAYLRTGQAQRAVELLEKFNAGNPDDLQILRLLSQGYAFSGDHKKYQMTLEKIGRLIPADYNTQINLAQLYISTGQHDRAATTLARLKPITDQQKMESTLLQAALDINRKTPKKALSTLAPLYDKNPNQGQIVMLYARALANDKQVDQAITVSQAWAKNHPDNLPVKRFLGDLHMTNGQYDPARDYYKSILQAKSGLNKSITIHAHNNLAMIYITQGAYDQAAKHARNALDIAPNNPAIVDTYAQVLMKQGKSEKAVEYYNQALALLPNADYRNRSLFSLGKARALVAGGNTEQASRILKRLLEDDPDFPQKDEVKRLLSEL